MKEIFDGIKSLLGYLVVTGVFFVLLLVDFLVSGYFLWGPLVSTPSGAPGARDGLGLILFFLLWLVATVICTALLGVLQGWLLKALFPWWEPPDESELL